MPGLYFPSLSLSLSLSRSLFFPLPPSLPLSFPNFFSSSSSPFKKMIKKNPHLLLRRLSSPLVSLEGWRRRRNVPLERHVPSGVSDRPQFVTSLLPARCRGLRTQHMCTCNESPACHSLQKRWGEGKRKKGMNMLL